MVIKVSNSLSHTHTGGMYLVYYSNSISTSRQFEKPETLTEFPLKRFDRDMMTTTAGLRVKSVQLSAAIQRTVLLTAFKASWYQVLASWSSLDNLSDPNVAANTSVKVCLLLTPTFFLACKPSQLWMTSGTESACKSCPHDHNQKSVANSKHVKLCNVCVIGLTYLITIIHMHGNCRQHWVPDLLAESLWAGDLSTMTLCWWYKMLEPRLSLVITFKQEMLGKRQNPWWREEHQHLDSDSHTVGNREV